MIAEARQSIPYVYFFGVMENTHPNSRKRMSNNNLLGNTIFADLGLDD